MTDRAARARRALATGFEFDPDSAILTATYADGARYEYAWVTPEVAELLTATPSVDQRVFYERVVASRDYRRVGDAVWRDPPSTDQTGLPPLDRVALARWLLLGEDPPAGMARRHAPRARRTGVTNTQVGPDGVTWRHPPGRPHHLPADQIASVLLADVEYPGSRGPGPVVAYALVMDAAGTVRLRVAASSATGASGAAGKKRLAQMWAPLGVPVVRHTSRMGRAKDLRRRWPEAFSLAHAYPFSITLAAVTFWMVAVVPVLDRVLGQ